jgi:alkylated DNA repair dioxygenase AlkB
VQALLDDARRNCQVLYAPSWLPRPEADALLARALASPLPQSEHYGQGVRAVATRRLSCAFGPPGLLYRYAGQVRPTHPWPKGLAALVERVGAAAGCALNFALVNVYPDGKAQLGWHSDSEPDLEPGAPIASLSLGATRDFQMRLGDSGGPAHAWPLGHGDLLVMAGEAQRFYQHRVPVRAGVQAPRVNFTFRRVRRS